MSQYFTVFQVSKSAERDTLVPFRVFPVKIKVYQERTEAYPQGDS